MATYVHKNNEDLGPFDDEHVVPDGSGIALLAFNYMAVLVLHSGTRETHWFMSLGKSNPQIGPVRIR